MKQQRAVGLTIINDGEFGKSDFVTYAADRLSGFELVPRLQSWHRFADWERFPDYYDPHPLFQSHPLNVDGRSIACVGPVAYSGLQLLERDLGNLQAALGEAALEKAFYPSISPGMVVDTYPNRYYPTAGRYLEAVADAIATEYEAIARSGLILQVDAPDLAQNFCYQSYEDLGRYLADTQHRIEVLNHALRNVPRQQIRIHVCWGSWWGPHETDVPLQDIIQALLRLRMGCLSIEAATVNHDADWHVWKGARIPDDLVLMPGVITHKTDTVEHPLLIADRLVRYASIVGRDRVIAGTDCGMVRCPAQSLAWAKFRAMAEGAAVASRRRRKARVRS